MRRPLIILCFVFIPLIRPVHALKVNAKTTNHSSCFVLFCSCFVLVLFLFCSCFVLFLSCFVLDSQSCSTVCSWCCLPSWTILQRQSIVPLDLSPVQHIVISILGYESGSRIILIRKFSVRHKWWFPINFLPSPTQLETPWRGVWA